MCNHNKKKTKMKMPARHFENFIQRMFFFTNIKNQQTGKKHKIKGKMNKTNKKIQKIKSLWFTLFSAILWDIWNRICRFLFFCIKYFKNRFRRCMVKRYCKNMQSRYKLIFSSFFFYVVAMDVLTSFRNLMMLLFQI